MVIYQDQIVVQARGLERTDGYNLYTAARTGLTIFRFYLFTSDYFYIS